MARALPVGQFISEVHTMNYLRFWMEDWILTHKRPGQVHVDESDALIGAAVRVFAEAKCIYFLLLIIGCYSIYYHINYSCNVFFPATVAYLDDCYRWLRGGKQNVSCFIRIDVAHFVAKIHRNKLLKVLNPIKRNLIKGIFGYLIKCSSIVIFEATIRRLFYLLNCEFTDSSAQKCRGELEKLIATHECTDEVITQDETVDSTDDETDAKAHKETVAYKWIANIYNDCAKEHSTPKKKHAIENIFFNHPHEDDALCKFLFFTLCRFPLWSNIMCESFGCPIETASSACVESHFRIEKSLLHKYARVDKFVENRILHLRGQFKLAIGEHIARKRHSKRPKSVMSEIICDTHIDYRPISSMSCFESGNTYDGKDESIHDLESPNVSLPIDDNVDSVNVSSILLDHSYSHVESNKSQSDESDSKKTEINPSENWKNINAKEPRRRRAINSILDPHDARRVTTTIPILPNGARTRGVHTYNTCGWDSLYFIYASSIADDHDGFYTDMLSNKSVPNEFLRFVNDTLRNTKKRVSSTTLMERNVILKRLYTPEDFPDNVTQMSNMLDIDCEVGIGRIFARIISMGNNDLASVKTTRTCCTTTKSYQNLIAVNMNTIQLSDLASSIYQPFIDSPKVCKKCKKRQKVEHAVNRLIALEVEPIEAIEDHEIPKKMIPIPNITPMLEICGLQYNLYGVIAYILEKKHFLAYIVRKDNIQVLDDLRQKNKYSGEGIYPFMLFYMKND